MTKQPVLGTLGMWLAHGVVWTGLCACNVLLGNSEAEMRSNDGGPIGGEAVADGGSSGVNPEGGPPPALDGGGSSSSGGVTDAGPGACPCGEDLGYCNACPPLPAVQGYPGITHLAVLKNALHYRTAGGSAHASIGQDGTLGPFPVPVAPGSGDFRPDALASAAPRYGEPLLPMYFELQEQTMRRRGEALDLAPIELVTAMVPAYQGVILKGDTSTRYAGAMETVPVLPSVSTEGMLVAANESQIFALSGAPELRTFWRQDYPAPATDYPESQNDLGNSTTMAANAEHVFFAPCAAASICSLSALVASTEVKTVLLTTEAVELLFVDGPILYVAANEKTLRCRFDRCVLEEVRSTKLSAFTIGSTHLYLAFGDQLVRIPRSPLRPSTSAP